MKYLQSTPFSVALGSKKFRDNWDATFGKKEEKPELEPVPPSDSNTSVSVEESTEPK